MNSANAGASMGPSEEAARPLPLTVPMLAAAKRLPAVFLGQLGLRDDRDDGVLIPYANVESPVPTFRRRTDPDDHGGWNAAGAGPCAYGQERLCRARQLNYLILVQGESDCWVLWHHDLPALGLPHADAAVALRDRFFEAVATIYVHRRPGAGGERFVDDVRKALPEFDYPGQVFELRLPAEVNDVADLHVADPERFKERLRQALADALPISLHSPPTPASPNNPVAELARVPASPNSCEFGYPSNQVAAPPQRGEESPASPDSQELGVCLADVRAEKVSWLMPERIPFGKVTILDGDPNLGKSSALLDLAARLTAGQPMPLADPSTALPPAAVILLTAEDGLKDTVRPRLEAAGADLTRVKSLNRVPGPTGQRPTVLPGDIHFLRQLVLRTKARLIIIDPLVAFLGDNVNSCNDQNIRRALLPLAELAEELAIAIVVIRHLNKRTSANAIYRGGGSIGIIAAARAGLLIARHPDHQGRRLLAVTKCNLAGDARALEFTLQSAGDSVRIHWLGEADYAADSLLAAPGDPHHAPALTEAIEFLEKNLAHGQVLAASLIREAQDIGISLRTLKRAKEHLGIKTSFYSLGYGGSGNWAWALPREDNNVPTNSPPPSGPKSGPAA